MAAKKRSKKTAAEDNKALEWLYKNGIQNDNLKSSVFFSALKGLYKSNATKAKLDKVASQYGNIVRGAISRKKTCKDKEYCLLLYRNSIALQHDIPTRALPLKKKKDVTNYKKSNKNTIIVAA